MLCLPARSCVRGRGALSRASMRWQQPNNPQAAMSRQLISGAPTLTRLAAAKPAARSFSVAAARCAAGSASNASTSSSSPAAPAPAAAPARASTSASAVPASTPSAGDHALEDSPHAALLNRLARLIMRDGKLLRAHSHIRTALAEIAVSPALAEAGNEGSGAVIPRHPVERLELALARAAPSIRLVNRRKGIKNVPTPQPLTDKQRIRQAWLWIVQASGERQGEEKEFGRRLAIEITNILVGKSKVFDWKNLLHRQAGACSQYVLRSCLLTSPFDRLCSRRSRQRWPLSCIATLCNVLDSYCPQ